MQPTGRRTSLTSASATIVATAFCALCSCSGLAPSTPDQNVDICPAEQGQPVRNNARSFGFFADDLYGNYDAALQQHVERLGDTPGYVLWFIDIDDSFPQQVVAGNWARGMRTVVSVNIQLSPPDTDSVREDTLLNEIVAGGWDARLGQFADRARAFGHQLYYRFGYEMNGAWFHYGEKPRLFVQAWCHTRDIFHQQGADSVAWVFSPGALWDGKTFEHDLQPYYPGDSVVDVVGLDGYNFGDGYDVYHSWQSFADVFVPTLLRVRQFGKPLWIAETGCPVDARRPVWIGDMLDYLDRNRCVEAVFWFDVHKDSEPDFRIDEDSASVSVLREWLTR
jgi:beta-mannanase